MKREAERNERAAGPADGKNEDERVNLIGTSPELHTHLLIERVMHFVESRKDGDSGLRSRSDDRFSTRFPDFELTLGNLGLVLRGIVRVMSEEIIERFLMHERWDHRDGADGDGR